MPTTQAEWIEACDELASTALNYFSEDGPVGEIFTRFLTIDEQFGSLNLPVVTKALGSGVSKFNATWAKYASPVSRMAQQWSTKREQFAGSAPAKPDPALKSFGTEFGTAFGQLYNEGFVAAAENLRKIAISIADALNAAVDAD